MSLLSNLAGPLQHFKAAILEAWRHKVSVDLCGRKGFRGGLCWMSMAPCSFLLLLMFEKEIRLCFAASWLGVSGLVFFLDRFEARLFHVGFVGRQMVMVIYVGNVPFLLLLRFVKILSFMISSEWKRDTGLGVCFGMVGFQSSGVNDASPSAANAAESAGYLVESALGSYSSGLLVGWDLPVGFDAVEAASLLPASPNVWTDGSLVLDRVTGVSSSGAGFLLISLLPAGIIGVGVMLIRFARLVIFSVVGFFFLLFLGLSSLFRELSCGVSFLLCSSLVLSILVLII